MRFAWIEFKIFGPCFSWSTHILQLLVISSLLRLKLPVTGLNKRQQTLLALDFRVNFGDLDYGGKYIARTQIDLAELHEPLIALWSRFDSRSISSTLLSYGYSGQMHLVSLTMLFSQFLVATQIYHSPVVIETYSII